jgi:hypothetical protein
MDKGTWAVTLITLVLFIAALFVKGFTHDLFIEAGVFLVSAKLIIMAYRNSVATKALHEKLDAILARLEK